jgi:hypothetical protein
LGATDHLQLITYVEGYRCARLGWGLASASPLTIGFFSKIHRPGAYSGSIGNAVSNRSYPFQFTQNVADTWEFKTVTISGDVTGTWAKDNSAGLVAHFCMACGTTYLGAPNTWTAANLVGATGTTNGVAATSDTFQITGLIVLPGIEVPLVDRAPFIMRPFDKEIDECQRLYEMSYDYGQVPGTSTANGCRSTVAAAAAYVTGFSFLKRKRLVPNVVPYSQIGTVNKWTIAGGADYANNFVPQAVSQTGVLNLNSSALTTGALYYGHFTADSRF